MFRKVVASYIPFVSELSHISNNINIVRVYI